MEMNEAVRRGETLKTWQVDIVLCIKRNDYWQHEKYYSRKNVKDELCGWLFSVFVGLF